MIQVRFFIHCRVPGGTVRSERRPTQYACSCKLQYLLVVMLAQAHGMDPKEGTGVCGTLDVGTTARVALPCGFKEVATLLLKFEAGKRCFRTSLKYIKVGFGGRRFQPLIFGPGTARAVLLGKREGLRSDGSSASRPCPATCATLCDHLSNKHRLHLFGNLRPFL